MTCLREDYPGSRRRICATNTDQQSRQYVVMRVKNRNLQFLINPGSSNSLISSKLAHNLGSKLERTTNSNPLIAASGQQLNVLGKTAMTFHVRGLIIVHSFTVIENLFSSLLIGDDFLRKNHAVINYANSTVSFYDGLVVLPLQNYNSCNNCACVHKTVCIPGYS